MCYGPLFFASYFFKKNFINKEFVIAVSISQKLYGGGSV